MKYPLPPSLDVWGSLNESPSEKEGKSAVAACLNVSRLGPLNESPSEKEGKSDKMHAYAAAASALNESPSEKEGKLTLQCIKKALPPSLNESPSEKEGKWVSVGYLPYIYSPSMKVPPKRKGNRRFCRYP